ncbi:hypothetical protein AAFC00_001629 [Neodothiora populina]|uniref:Amino acid transporter transmembrane domain-containing protein n=1 Tax=Neodothiora populina TaxID=2781224 RepID=A0ABR3PPM4_9PEZI
MATNAGLGGVADPRLGKEVDVIPNREVDVEPPNYNEGQSDGHEKNVSFEEYLYFANWTREYEKTLSTTGRGISHLTSVLGTNKEKKIVESEMSNQDQSESTTQSMGVITDYEWHQASRAARTATWGAVFYLITTDILGPFSVPWAFAQLGYGPGIALYLVFGVLAGYAGILLWRCFLGLDSDKYPVKNYGDIAYRIYGSWARHVCNVLQSCQFFLNVCLLIISNGQGIAQLSQPHSYDKPLCFVACLVIFMAAGMIIGQIRTLARFSLLANAAVWMNVFIIIMTMAVVGSTQPNYKAVFNTSAIPKGPIVTTGGVPPGKDLRDNINGLMQAVFSYGGATLFNELMAEMRRPMDFWKGMICAEVFIFWCYIIFGLVVYSYQGQFAYNPAYQGINPYAWQTVGNVLSLLSGLIAACLYGNIGIKVLYATVGRGFLKFPPLESKTGKLIWVGFVPLYWGLAFIVGAAVPQISNLSAFVGAAMILQFSYTFPPLLSIGFNVLKDSMTEADHFNPSNGTLVRSGFTWDRIKRGFRVQLWKNSFNVFFFLGATVTAILGMYSSIYAMNEAYSSVGSIDSFSCKSPTG